ncbi:meiosis initiator protein isoform X1 [Symphalangus syndactylus]|uniref:meiosis initiator protein isoform X1 n=1 Tax=Symphalangus syndactylus TaxID=9590 RepID=UPI002441ADDB|nr:meiosis initiator protein isoform X1 [Symphalangus syndactylus]XP_055107033.1 meiosis initiator protein isoform X1 [Symphalangus syndactylus]
MFGSSRYLGSSEQPRANSLGPSDRTLVLCSLVEGEDKVSPSEPHGLRMEEKWLLKGKLRNQRNQNQLLSPNKKQRKNHTSKLQELALLLPIALKTGTKKLTKKEILVHVLQYIQYLQRNIDAAKALFKGHITTGEGGLAGLGQNPAWGPARQRRHSTPSSSPSSQKSHLQGACQKPRKKKLTQASESQTRTPKPRRSLALNKPEKLVTLSPDQKGSSTERTTTPPRCPDFCGHPRPASSSPPGDRKGGQSQLTLLDLAEDTIHCDISGCWCQGSVQDEAPFPALLAQEDVARIHFLNKTQPHPRQKLVFYDSSEDVDKGSLDADPWLPAWTPENSPQGSPLLLGPPQIDVWSGTGHPSEILRLSPGLFSSPGKLLPDEILEDDMEYLTQAAFFEEVCLDLESSPSAHMQEAPQEKDTASRAPKDPPESHSLHRSSVSLDHCYLSLSGNSKAPSSSRSSSSSSSSSEDSDSEPLWKQREDMQANTVGTPGSSEEDEDTTWTPTQLASPLPAAKKKARKGQVARAPVKPKEKKKGPCPPQMKKKCVNGFIMFCRMNRKQYIRSCPGTASTAATKELAQLWRVMTQQERRPYCTKARRFSRQHNRIVKQDGSSSEAEDWETPKPFYQLLAEKALPLPPHLQ